MQTIPLKDLIQLHAHSVTGAPFLIASGKSTFVEVAQSERLFPQKHCYWASPTRLCGDSARQYHPCFIMAVLSVTPFPDSAEIETFHQIELPKVLFHTHPDIRRSMTLNAMRMSTELFAVGSQRLFQLARQRLEANQPDVVHDLLVYLMHAVLDARREFAQESALRAESLAAYLGIDPAKVLSLMIRCNDELALAKSLEEGEAGKLQRKINIAALVKNQMELLAPVQQSAIENEIRMREIIDTVVKLWKVY